MVDYKYIHKALTSTDEHKTKKIEFEQYSNEDFFDFLTALCNENLILHLDWSGESRDNEIYDFVTDRLNAFGVSLQLDNSKILKELLLGVEKGKIERGDSIPFLIKKYQRSVSKLGFVIFDVFTGSDAYFIGICKKPALTKLKKFIIADDICFLKFGATRSTDLLYVIDCKKCGSKTNLWELPIGNPPTKGHCDSCGIDLFDESGNPIFEVKKKQK